MSTTRSKAWGYQVEVAALQQLKDIFPKLRRTGSMAYKKSAADLVQEGTGSKIRLIVTRDKHHPLLVTLSAADFWWLMQAPDFESLNVVVQVKGRQSTWIGRLWRELRDAT